MAFDAPPFIMDGTNIDAEIIRRAINSLISPAGGIVSPGDLTVTQNGTPNMSVNVGTGEVWVPGTSTSSQGLYYAMNKATINVAISASNPTSPRIDTIIAQVQDAEYAGSTSSLGAAVVTGTPTAGATLANLNGRGTVPASSYVLAYVLVPANATSITNTDIDNVASTLSTTANVLTPVLTSGNITASRGQAVMATGGAALTVTLPVASAGDMISVAAASTQTGSAPVTVAATSPSAIFGLGLGASGSASFALGAPNASALLLGLASGKWQIISGQQDTGWLSLTLNTAIGIIPSGFTPACRLIGDRVLLRGGMENNSGSNLSPGSESLATVPTPCRPASTPVTLMIIPGGSQVTIASSGSMTTTNSPGNGVFVNGDVASLDGTSYTPS